MTRPLGPGAAPGDDDISRPIASTASPTEDREAWLPRAVAWAACITLLCAVALPGAFLPRIALVSAAAFALTSRDGRGWSAVDAAALAVAAACALSWLLSPLQVRGAPALSCAVIAWGVSRLRFRQVAFALTAGVIAIGTLVLTQVALLAVHAGGEVRPGSYGPLTEWGGYPELGLLGAIIVPVLVGLTLHARPPRVALAAALASLLAALGLILSFARASWASATFAIAVLLLATRSRRAVIAVILAAGLVAAAWTYVPLVSTYTSMLFSRTGNVAVNARSEAWQLAWTVWRPRWLVGWGPGTYAEAYALRHPGSIADARFHAHNALIHTGVETGLLGAAAAVGLVLVVLLRAGRNLHAGDPIVRGIRVGLLASLIGVAARFQVDYFDPGSAPERVMVLLSIVAGLAVALGRDDGATAAAARADSSPR